MSHMNNFASLEGNGNVHADYGSNPIKIAIKRKKKQLKDKDVNEPGSKATDSKNSD